ncbi:unnamed protein product [Dovyalis caffra]|uniref:Uncharacterized protein n=1 Tax=Dovyalis caffra TaxID=77055 RepID=A0AAV1S4R2_9ROSI|nr:unnamed protein product [Dovyalis caffra]
MVIATAGRSRKRREIQELRFLPTLPLPLYSSIRQPFQPRSSDFNYRSSPHSCAPVTTAATDVKNWHTKPQTRAKKLNQSMQEKHDEKLQTWTT